MLPLARKQRQRFMKTESQDTARPADAECKQQQISTDLTDMN
jgi:hypothetical protein